MDLGEEIQRVDDNDTEDDELLSSPSGRMSQGLLQGQMGPSHGMGHVQAPSSLGMPSSGTSEPEVSMAMDSTMQQLQQLNQSEFQELPVLSLSQSRSIAQSLANRLLNVSTPMMTQTNMLSLKRPPPLDSSDIPRKKSRNYLDSHKSIEKRRRDRINNCLGILKNMVPDCRQYGNKKLDKAEILEMSIDYVQRIQQQAFGKGGGAVTGLDLLMAQREWASELTAWIIQNKLLFSGPTALDQFTNSLLLHLQGYSSSHMQQAGSLPTAAQLQSAATGASSADESHVDPMYRQILLQQLQTSVSGQVANAVRNPVGAKSLPTTSTSSSSVVAASISQATSSDPGQQPAITASSQVQQHLQAILLLQQQQSHLLQQQQEDQGDSTSDPQTQQQIQQLQNLQLLIAQHLTSEGMSQKLNLQQLATLLHLLQQHQMQKDEEREAPEQGDIMPQTPPTMNQTTPPDLGSLGIPHLHEATSVAEMVKRPSVLMSLQEGYLTTGASQESEHRGEWPHVSDNTMAEHGKVDSEDNS